VVKDIVAVAVIVVVDTYTAADTDIVAVVGMVGGTDSAVGYI